MLLLKRIALCAFVACIFACAKPVTAQTTAAPALVPTPILTAKTVFISNASGEMSLPAGTADLTYQEFYGAMKTWGRYEITLDPTHADLIVEIRFMGDRSRQNFQFRARIFEPKTHVLLWAFCEGVQQSTNQKKSRQYFDVALATLLADLKSLTVPAPSAAPQP